MLTSDNDSSLVIHSHATFNDAPHRRDWSYGIVRLENDKFTFVDVHGKILVSISAREIQKIATQDIGGAKSFVLVTSTLDTKPQIYNFSLYKVGGEEGKYDTHILKIWRSAFLRVGVKNDNTKIMIIAIVVFIIAGALVFITKSGTH